MDVEGNFYKIKEKQSGAYQRKTDDRGNFAHIVHRYLSFYEGQLKGGFLFQMDGMAVFVDCIGNAILILSLENDI